MRCEALPCPVQCSAPGACRVCKHTAVAAGCFCQPGNKHVCVLGVLPPWPLAERALEEEVQRVRLKNIHLANALKKLESTIRNKEQLAGGAAAAGGSHGCLHATHGAAAYTGCLATASTKQAACIIFDLPAPSAVPGVPVLPAEGLHLIDFEQLKIENQSLNEKIEERNEELVKLRKKTTVTVQVSTAACTQPALLHACPDSILPP